MSKFSWMILPWIVCAAANVVAAEGASSDDQLAQGKKIYLEGKLISGDALVARQNGQVVREGANAACVNCHRHSGMGMVEGDFLVPPITGNYLYHPDQFQVTTMDPRSGKQFNQTHQAYTDETLARAIRQGVHSDGQPLQPLMPQFEIGDQDMAALIAYVKQLSVSWPASVDAQTMHVATIITPGVDSLRRKAFLDTLQMAVTQKNGSTLTSSGHRGRHHMTSAAEMVLGTERKWQLHVWELQGTADTWAAQLDAKLKAQPVFAVLSGLSDSSWEPIDQFCNSNHLPCWFPNVTLPGNGKSFYSVYFNRGVLLEADVLASQLSANKPKRLLQIRSANAVPTAATQQLAANASKQGIEVVERVVANAADAGKALKAVKSDDLLMVWMPGSEWSKLEKAKPPKAKAIYASTELLAGKALPKAWQAAVHLIYPYELPDKRQANLVNFRAWHAMKKLPIVDEPMQADTFFAVEFLTETAAEMLDNLYPDYLLERAETMLSRSDAVKSEQQVRERQMRGTTGALTQQSSTSIYPRLGLSIDQRFASKGAYLVHFDSKGNLIADSDWIIP